MMQKATFVFMIIEATFSHGVNANTKFGLRAPIIRSALTCTAGSYALSTSATSCTGAMTLFYPLTRMTLTCDYFFNYA